MTPLVIPFSDTYLKRAVVGASVLVVGVAILLITPGVFEPLWETVLDLVMVTAVAAVVLPTMAMWRRHQNGEPALFVDSEMITSSIGLRRRQIPIRQVASIDEGRSGVLIERDDGTQYRIPTTPLGGDLSPVQLRLRLEDALGRGRRSWIETNPPD
jgi:hypothetical protein